MSSAHPERIKLSTGAITIVRAPLGRGKSGIGAASFWGALLPEVNSRDQLDRNGPEREREQDQQQHQQQPLPGMPPIPGAGPVPWRDAVTATSSKALQMQLGTGAGRSTRRNLLAAQPSSRMMTGIGASGGGGGGGAVSFRRNGVASAPIVGTGGGGGGGDGVADSADADRGRLPAIGGASRPAAASASGTAPGPVAAVPAKGIAALPSAIRGAIRRNIVSLPSIHGAVDLGGDGGGSGGGAAGLSPDEEPPIVVSFVPSRPPSGNNRAMRRGLSRPAGRSVVKGGTAGGGDGVDDGGGNDESNTDTSSSGSAAAAPGRGGGRGRGGGGLLRGIRRLFLKESRLDAGAASRAAGGGDGGSAAAANPSDDTVRQDDRASSLHAQHSSKNVSKLAHEYAREQERVSRIRTSLLGGELRLGLRQSGGGGGGGGGADNGGGGPGPAEAVLSPVAAHQLSRKWSEPPAPPPPLDAPSGPRALRSGKSFTQKALEDPDNPAFKTAKQLVAVQEKLSYMEDHSWREKAAEMVTKERPIPLGDGWKL